MGLGYSKSYQRKVLRFLIAVLLIISGITYTLYNQQHTNFAGLSIFSPSSTAAEQAAEQAHTDQISRLGQQQERLEEENVVPKTEVIAEQTVASDVQEKDTTNEQQSTITKRATVGKMTVSFGEPDEVFDRAIHSHELHNKRMGYPYFILRERVLPGLYSKHAFIFSVIVQELAKPEAERLQWVMWLDRDTVLMNPLLRLEDFLPPPDFDRIYLLATNDRHGLNNGVFMLRVNEWSLKLFSAALAFRHYNPDFPLKYSEQSAMEEIMNLPWYNTSTAMVPQHWFNSFNPPSTGRLLKSHARPGSLLIHFASNRDGGRPERMKVWMDIAEQQKPEWTVPINETYYPAQFEEYWQRRRSGENVANIVRDLENRPR